MKEFYFAYGCNMSVERMTSRCQSARVIGKGFLSGYKLTFPQPDEYWGGGVAGLFADDSRKIEGVVYEISPEDLAKLDEIEITEDEEYWRESVRVKTAQGLMEVWIYFAKEMVGSPFTPSKRYLDTMVAGAKEHGLSDEYVKEITDWGPRST